MCIFGVDFSIARMGLEDCEEVDDDIEARVLLDPSVWSSKDRNDDAFNHKHFNGMMTPENFMPHIMSMSNSMNMAGPSMANALQQQQMANQAAILLNASRQVCQRMHQMCRWKYLHYHVDCSQMCPQKYCQWKTWNEVKFEIKCNKSLNLV